VDEDVFWQKDWRTVTAVLDAAGRKPALAYNSVLKRFAFWKRRGYLKHEKDG